MNEYDKEAVARLFSGLPQETSGVGRPPAATAGAMIAVVPGGLGLMSALLGLLVSAAMGSMTVLAITPIALVFEHFRELASAQAVFSVLLLVSGSNVLRRVRWARRGTQGLMVLYAALLLSLGMYMASSAPACVGPADAAFMSTWRSQAILSSIVWGAGPAAAVLWLLEHRSVKEWFALGRRG